MGKIQVFLLGHKSQVGKDTLSDELINRDGFIRVAFADKLKETVKDLYNFTDEQMYGSLKNVPDHRYPNTLDEANEPTHFTPRRILQIFGQQQRSIYPNIWASYIFSTVIPKYVNNGHDKFVVSDFRFPNEYFVARQWVERSSDHELLCVKIERPEIENLEYSGKYDISETALNNFQQWDVELTNHGSIAPDTKYILYKDLHNAIENRNTQIEQKTNVGI